MKPIKCFNKVKVKVYLTLGRGVSLYFTGRAPRIVVDVAEHHLPIKAVERQLVACGKLPMNNVKDVIHKLKCGEVEKRLFGDTAVISLTY